MKTKKLIAGGLVTSVVLAAVMAVTPGCGSGDFLGLEDYQRDFLTGGLLAAALLNQAGGGAGDGDGSTATLDGRDGIDGLVCWDLDGDGVGDPEEDTNGDGEFNARDCEGPAGSPGRDGPGGATGAAGPAGTAGVDGVDCWDLNGNGLEDASEDINQDGQFNALDCRGPDGPQGPSGTSGTSGLPGQPGADGMSLFSIFIDDFFVADGEKYAELPIVLVNIVEPFLGWWPSAAGEQPDAVAYRAPIPEMYDAGNDVLMRIFLYRTGSYEEGCFVLTLDALRLRDGSGIEAYGGQRWIRIDVPLINGGPPAGDNGVADGFLLVVDLPINTAAGLDLGSDLAAADMLAFELGAYWNDGGAYQILGVEFSESRPGTAELNGAAVFFSEGDVNCGFVDCNQNGEPDPLDITTGGSFDCNEDGIPDECAACPPLDLVFLMDTSGSMFDEGVALCDSIASVVAELAGRGITLNPEILAIAPYDVADLPPCVTDINQSVAAEYDGTVPGDNGSCPGTLVAEDHEPSSDKDENWGSATAIIAERYSWTPGAIRVIVPISDEGACLGGPGDCETGSDDRDAVANAVSIANQNNVVVSPISADYSSDCVIALTNELADGTGGSAFSSDVAAEDLPLAISSLVEEICRLATDCNLNEIPDECELEGNDCNENGILDECDGGCDE